MRCGTLSVAAASESRIFSTVCRLPPLTTEQYSQSVCHITRQPKARGDARHAWVAMQGRAALKRTNERVRWLRDCKATRPRPGAGGNGWQLCAGDRPLQSRGRRLGRTRQLGITAAEPGSLRLLPPATRGRRTAPVLSTGFLVGRHEAGSEGRPRSSSRPPLSAVRREQRQATAAATRCSRLSGSRRAPRRPVR